MFGWIRGKQVKEQKKLLFQNSLASSGALQACYTRFGQFDAVSRLNEISEETRGINDRFRQSGSVSEGDLKNLVSSNRELRQLYDHAELHGPEAKVRAMMGQAVKPPDFDATFKPSHEWERHFADE